MTRPDMKERLLQYLAENYVSLTPITSKELAAVIKELDDDQMVMGLLEELKAEGKISILESMKSVFGTEIIMQLSVF